MLVLISKIRKIEGLEIADLKIKGLKSRSWIKRGTKTSIFVSLISINIYYCVNLIYLVFFLKMLI